MGKEMKIAVMSDTHGNVSLALKGLKRAGRVDRLIHLGDHYSDAVEIGKTTGIQIDAVSGNTDVEAEPQASRELILEIDGVRLLVTHGDMYRVKGGLDRLMEKAISEEVDCALFGHTHISLKQRIGGILYLNPGCILHNNAANSLAVLNLTKGRIGGEIINI